LFSRVLSRLSARSPKGLREHGGLLWLAVCARNDYGTTCWLLAADGSDEAVVFDPGFSPGEVRSLLDAGGKRPAAVLLTHAHLDHAGSAGAFAGEVPVYVHPDDRAAFDDYTAWGGMTPTTLDPVQDLRTFEDGDRLRFGGFDVEVLHTPGHTPGSCCFRVGGDVVVFTGDLVFAGTIGRTDFANSDPQAMRTSLERYLTLPDDLRTLPGHGPETTVGAERAANPFLRELG
jgi:glyoxylase-like metal-dependent hydrolase (beta-lactamase superfamily II)